MSRKDLVLLDPESRPALGLVSARDQASLSPGEWAQLDNLRYEKGLLSCRGGMSASLGTVLASATFKGIWKGYLWNSYCIVVALEVGGAVRIYRSTNATSWAELTASSGKYGNTRFSTSGGVVRFTVVPRTFGTEDGTGSILLACNGADEVLAITSANASKVTEITAPLPVQDKPVLVDVVQFFMDMQPLVAGDFSATGAGISLAVNGADPNLQARLSITSGVTNGSTATITESISNVTASALDRQLLIGVDTAYSLLWDKVKVTVGGTVVWDPSDAGNYTRPVPVFLDNSQRALWVFNFPKLSGTTTLTTVVFTWIAATIEAPASTQTVDIFTIALTYGGGLVKADASLAVSSVNSGSGTESPGVVYSTYQTERIKDIGGPVLGEARVPRSPVLNAVFYAAVIGVSTTERDAGVNRVNFYVKETGSTRYRYFYTQALTSYAGAWSYTVPTGAAVTAWILAGPDTYTTIYPDIDMPSAFNKCIPDNATEVCWANNRLLVGKDSTENLSISEYKIPMRHTLVPRFENGRAIEQSGTFLSFEGETVKAIVPIAASTAGSSTIFVFTDQNVYALSGQTTSQLSQVGRVANIGTASPLSIIGDKGDLYFVDNDMQVRVLANGGIGNITRSVIDDKLKAVTGSRRKWLMGAIANDLYYLAYSESSTNNKVAVWDMDERKWTTDTPAKSIEGLVSWFDGTNLKLRLIAIGIDGSDLKGYEYDLSTQAQDLGTTNITCTLEPFELHLPDGGMFHVGRCKAMIDDVDSVSATIRRTYKPVGTYQETTMSLDTSNEHIYREDRIEGATVTGSGRPEGPRCRVTFSVPMQSQDKIRYLALEVNPIGGGQDRP